ncbi:MAG: hypothetical protein APF76_04260 [Desulfitibacter sp. BRH_c19]|nr:MAG: hypothetical protein APF76_04260 [Desulfitibacter sp. BRH_c19]
MSGVGEKLRERRISLGLSIEQVEEYTKIRRFYIEAIENNEYKVLPGKVYIIGFLRSYCKLLDLDPTEILEEFNQSWIDTDNVSKYVEETSYRQKKSPKVNFNYSKLVRFGILVLAVIVLIGINKIWNNTIPSPPPPNDTIISEPNENNEDETPNEDINTEPEYAGVNIEVIPERGDCWLEVSINNTIVFSRIITQGEDSLIFEDENGINMVFGDAGAVDIVYNGQLIEPIGNDGEVVRKTFSIEDDI